MEPAANLSVDVQPIGRRLGLSMQIEAALWSRLAPTKLY
jgi:hypothetical protein